MAINWDAAFQRAKEEDKTKKNTQLGRAIERSRAETGRGVILMPGAVPAAASPIGGASGGDTSNGEVMSTGKYGRGGPQIRAVGVEELQLPAVRRKSVLTLPTFHRMDNSPGEPLASPQEVQNVQAQMKGLWRPSDALRDGVEDKSARRDELERQRSILQRAQGRYEGAWLDKVDMKPGESAADALKRVEAELAETDRELAGQHWNYYAADNEEQLARLARQPESGTLYEQAGTAGAPDVVIGRVLSALQNGGAPEGDGAAVAQIRERFGVSPEKSGSTAQYMNDLTALLGTDLETRDVQTEAIGELKRRGYNYSRISGYERTRKEAEEYARKMEERQEAAREHPVLSSAASVLASPLQGLDFLDTALRSMGPNSDEKDLSSYVPLDPYAMEATNLVRTLRGQVAEDLAEKYDWEVAGQNVASFLYQTGMSVADSAAQIAAFGPAATYFMGASAASSQAQDIMARGGTNRQVLLGGLAAGAAEAVFEKFSIDHLLSARTVGSAGDLLRETLKQAGVEASEETFTEIANILSDAAIMGGSSGFNLAVRDYMAQGMSEKEARKRAYLDLVGQVAWAGAGGALSGAAMGGAVNTKNYINQNVVLPGGRVTPQNAVGSVNERLSQPGQVARDMGGPRSLLTEEQTAPWVPTQPVSRGGTETAPDGVRTEGRVDTLPDITAAGRQAASTGEASGQMQGAMDRLSRGETVSLEELYQIPEIMEVRSRSFRPTSEIDTPERTKLRGDVVQKLYQQGSYTGVDKAGDGGYNGPVNRDRRADIVIGVPAAGKSSVLVDPLSQRYGSRVIDSDMAKALLPEYDSGKGASAVHRESSMIRDQLLDQAMDQGDNLVWPQVGGDLKSLIEEIQMLKDEGYQVNLHLNELPAEKAVGRALGRFIHEGRYIDPGIVLRVGDAPTRNYQALRQMEGFLDGYSRYSNDVAFGERPILIESSDTATGMADLGGLPGGRGDGPGGSAQTGGEAQGREGARGTGINADGVDGALQSRESGFEGRPEHWDTHSGKGPDGSVGAMKSRFEYEQKQSSVSRKTFSRMYWDVLKELERADADPTRLHYDVVTERQSLERAQERLTTDLAGEMADLPRREAWGSEDMDTAMGVLDRLLYQAREDGDYSEFNRWTKLIQEKGTQAGQMIQAFSKYNRTPVGILVEAADTLEKAGVSPEVRNRVMEAMSGFSKTLDTVERGDGAALVDLIKAQAGQRGTRVSAATEQALRAQDTQYLYDFALSQLSEIANDYQRVSAGKKLSTYQAFSHLFNAKTALRNLVSNQVFDVVDAAANDVGLIPDALMSLFTRRRTVGVEKSWVSGQKRSGAVTGAQQAWAEVALDVDMGGSSKYGTGGRRTNKMVGTLPSRLMSTAEKAMGFELNVTDEFHKGSVRGEVLESLAPLVEKGYITQNEAATWAEQEALYRSFQDDTLPGALLAQMKDAMNLVGIGDSGRTLKGKTVREFGLGDLVQKYTQVPGALMSRAVEYSPVGYAKALWTLANAAQNGGVDASAQRGAALAMGRATTGTGLVALFASLAAAGLLGRSDDEDDKDIAALYASEGLSGTQLNLSGLERWISGEDSERRSGDVLMSLDFLEPLNALMTVGELVAEDDSGKGFFGKTVDNSLEGTFQAILDTPTMQTFQTVFDAIRYHKEDGDTPLYVEVPVEVAKSSVTGFIPGLVRQTAQMMDPVYRDTYTSDNPLQQTADALKNSVPGLRETLPIKVTPFGEDKDYSGSEGLRFASTFLMPGALNVYGQSEVSRELQAVRKETGAANIYPDRNPPKNVRYDGELYELTAEERDAYQRRRGQAAYGLMESLMDAKVYQRAGADEKAELLEDTVAYANDLAKREALVEKGVDYESGQWEKAYAAAEAGIDWDIYLEYKEAVAGAESDGDAAKLRLKLYQDKRLSAKQADTLDKLLVSALDWVHIKRDVEPAYGGTGDEFTVSLMTAAAQKKWPVMRDQFGMDAETFREVYGIYQDDGLDTNGKKKQLNEMFGFPKGVQIYTALGKK